MNFCKLTKCKATRGWKLFRHNLDASSSFKNSRLLYSVNNNVIGIRIIYVQILHVLLINPRRERPVHVCELL